MVFKMEGMMNLPTLHGIIPPVPTPFTRSGDLDLNGLQSLLTALEPLVDGFLILGSNGEAVYLSEEERLQVLQAAREVIPRNKVMLAGTGGEATHLVKERNRVAAEVGADVVLVLPPHYYQGRMTDGALERHYRTLADESSVPVMLYNVPANTTIALSPALIERLAQHSNIVGLKDSSGNIFNLTEIMRRVPDDFTVLTGNAPTLLPALSLGARGGILAVANVAPQDYGDILRHFKSGDLARARALQLRHNPLALAVTTKYGVAGLKAALRLQGLAAGYPRAPLTDVDSSVEDELRTLLEIQVTQ
jgi:4-hydroxy-2-oxoglutarate aldolase